MKEILDYVSTLKTRGLDVVFRELKSRFIRGSVKKAVRRVMSVCEERGAIFTFFITGNCAIVNHDFIHEIVDRGHEIACHGYNHLRFDLIPYEEGKADIIFAKKVFMDLFNVDLLGFRAPYLGMNSSVVNILNDTGLLYSSSVMSYTSKNYSRIHYNNGIVEFPISVCDWHSLIRDNKSQSEFINEMVRKQRPDAVFELHPWRIGQKKYINTLSCFLDQCKIPCVGMSSLIANKNAMALSGDLGELGISELVVRALCPKVLDQKHALHIIEKNNDKI